MLSNCTNMFIFTLQEQSCNWKTACLKVRATVKNIKHLEYATKALLSPLKTPAGAAECAFCSQGLMANSTGSKPHLTAETNTFLWIAVPLSFGPFLLFSPTLSRRFITVTFLFRLFVQPLRLTQELAGCVAGNYKAVSQASLGLVHSE